MEAYNNRGITYVRRGDVDCAIKDFDTAIIVDSVITFTQDPVRLQTAPTSGCADIFGLYYKLKPECAEAYVNRGTAYRDKGEMDKAIADYTKSIVLKPKIAESYYTRGEAWLRIRKWEEAQRDLTAAILQGVDIAEVFHNTHDSIAAFEEETGVKLPEDRDLILAKPLCWHLRLSARHVSSLLMKRRLDRKF